MDTYELLRAEIIARLGGEEPVHEFRRDIPDFASTVTMWFATGARLRLMIFCLVDPTVGNTTSGKWIVDPADVVMFNDLGPK